MMVLANMRDHLAYVEGFAARRYGDHVNIVLGLHAWAVDEQGSVIDPTWDDGAEYFGVPFNLRYVARVTVAKGVFGVIDNWQDDFPLLNGTAEGWQIEKAA